MVQTWQINPLCNQVINFTIMLAMILVEISNSLQVLFNGTLVETWVGIFLFLWPEVPPLSFNCYQTTWTGLHPTIIVSGNSVSRKMCFLKSVYLVLKVWCPPKPGMNSHSNNTELQRWTMETCDLANATNKNF